ncbi:MULTISPECIES: restriction endonuclease subunit S [Vibrio]|uniref:restriction endonuclease subunit S n=1 Tax=Vibrio TaxID=662 RepID=UPI000CD0B670|nr:MULTISPECIES: restriction endonuclease subunit S [Vibrio]POB18649.1 restriction endonuclease subunit S [Vibrio vulnificus]
MVPNGWVHVTFGQLINSGDITKIQDGNHGNSHPKASDFVTEGIPFVMARDLSNGSIDFSSCAFITKKQADSLRIGFAIEGDVLISHKGTIGEVAIVPEVNDYVMLTPQVTYYRMPSHSKLQNKYLYQYFLSHDFQNRLKSLASQSTRSYLGITAQKELYIDLPPLPEQRKIAQILSTWDRGIATTEKLIDASKQQKKALMQQLLTGKKRLVDPDTDKAFQGDWEEVKIKSLITKHSEKTERSGQYPVLTSSRKGIFFQSDYYNDRDVASEDTTGYNVVPRGFFTYRHMSDDLVFKFNINSLCDRGIVSTLYPVFAAKENIVVPYLLRAILNNGSEFKRFSLSQKQGGSRTYMYLSKLNELKIKIPKLKEQQKIVSVLTAADKEIESLEAKLVHFKQEKKALMQQLLTGKCRVKV